MLFERKRVGDEIETREQIEDFAIDSLMIRAPKLNRNSSTSLERKTPPITEKTENKRKSSASPKPKTPVPPVEKKKKSALIEKKKLSNKSGKKSVSFELEVASPGAGKRKSPEPKRKVSEPPKKKSLRSTKGK